MATKAQIQGDCDQRYERVKRAFAENFEERGELGASVSVTVDGRPVVDLWGGHLDHAKTKPWQRDNIVNVWSTTKGSDGYLRTSNWPVKAVWISTHRSRNIGRSLPRAANPTIPVSYLLNHKAGLAAIRAPLKQ